MKKRHIGILAAGSACLLSGTSLAQDQDAQSRLLEEIVVTSERREQSLQDVPLSITAFGDEKRDMVGILTIQDMADFAPGVSYNTSTDSPSIRGIARQSNIYTLDSPVANYIDGVYSGTVQDAGRRPIFVERTEILRGPQGALAGRGSIGGAVNTILKRPADKFGVEVRTFTGNYDAWGAEATITGPLTDWLRARLNLARTRQNEGFFENVSTGKTEGSQLAERDVADIMFDATLGNFDWYVKTAWVDYVEGRHSSVSLAPYSAGVLGSPTPWGVSASTVVPIAGWGYFDPTAERLGNSPQNPAIHDVWKFSNDLYSTQELIDDYNNYTSDLVWHGSAFDVRYIFGAQDYTYSQWEDDDGTDVRQMTLPPFGRVVFPGGTDQYIEDRHWSSHEITFASTHDGPVQWVVGLFRSDEETRQEPLTTTYPGYAELETPLMTLDALLAQLGLPHDPVNALRPVPVNAPGRAVFGRIDAETTSRAIFGQVDYQFSEELKFTLGLRYNEDEKIARESSRIVANNLGPDLGPVLAGGYGGFLATGTPFPMAVDVTPVPVAGAPLPEGVVRDHGIDPVTGYRVRDLENTWDATTGSIGVDYTPDPESLIFARFAVGYRPGGFNAGYINDIPQVDEETVYSYEVGYKTTLADRLQLSTTAFYYDFENSQQELPTLGRCTEPGNLSSCSILNTFVNVPESESLGLEVELNWAATDRLGVYLTYGYLDATIKDGLPDGTQGFSNPDDPAAILPGANRYRPVPGQIDAGYTFLPRYSQDISGNKLANSPEHKVALNLNYSWDFSAGSFTLSGNYIWRDESYADLFENELATIPSYSLVGLRALWTDVQNRYTIILYGSNLTDEEAPYSAGLTRLPTGAASAAAPGADGQAFFQTLSLAPPRQYGIELQYRFGMD